MGKESGFNQSYRNGRSGSPASSVANTNRKGQPSAPSQPRSDARLKRSGVGSGSRNGIEENELGWQSMSARLKELERENRELRKANEILRMASAYFAQAELDRKQK
jgi:transposase-like protein